MSYLVAVLASLLLLVGFVMWSWLETRTGFRLFPRSRRRFDSKVARTAFVIRHIDWAAFFQHLARSSAERIAHDLVHTTLIVVRAMERMLTRTIRTLRERVAQSAEDGPPVEGSQLIATIVRFRKSFKRDQK
ncbi:MAG: hypothetical protein JWO84_581 [Parcubacteria group bacterium]|nr:hypothetical protein [Parcubacteria group bacterium]